MKTEKKVLDDWNKALEKMKQDLSEFCICGGLDNSLYEVHQDRGAAVDSFGSSIKKDLDQIWDLLVKNVKELKLKAMDFSDLWDEDDVGVYDEESLTFKSALVQNTNKGSPMNLCPLASPKVPGSTSAKKKTIKLFWNEIHNLPALPKFSRFGQETIWASLEPINVDTNKLEYLFESRSKDLQLIKNKSGQKKELIVLEVKRSNVINIGLTTLPPTHIIRAAILSFDECVIQKEEVEKLLSLMPMEKEVEKIREAQLKDPYLPLGTAEQFLFSLSSIPDLPTRLRLWAFKLDYDNKEREIAEPLFNLKLAMEQLADNKTFRCILATLLAIGNFLNGCNAKGFELSYLEKVPQVKDTVHHKTLIYHTCHILLDNFPDTTDLYSQITAVTKAAKVDYVQVHNNLIELEANYKASCDYVKVIFRHESYGSLKSRLSAFLKDCAQRISILKDVHRRVLNRFHSCLLFFGYPGSAIRKMSVNKFFKLISDFALEIHTMRVQILQWKEKQEKMKAEDTEEVGEAVKQKWRWSSAMDPMPYNLQNDSPGSSPYSSLLRHKATSDVDQRHKDMKEILNTPERNRKFDLSLPRARSKKKESKGKN
ncbi:FH1/FH2 domain-containing protein 3-like [Latimeria chalumnae]|uniref:FH1/FH2 domain-containing protein 3-like n=1 Tax=Latimeria chalumnae TaxID=7897 RepID=UPI00313BA18E